MSDQSIEILEAKLASVLAEITQRQAVARGLAMAIALIQDDSRGADSLADEADIPGLRIPIEQPEPKPERPKHRRNHYHLGQPWAKRGNVSYWRKQVAKEVVDVIWNLLADSGREGLTQQELVPLATERLGRNVDSAGVSRAITLLWKLEELEWLGQEKGKNGGNTIRWRLWEGEGSPPIPDTDNKEGTA